jgi:hypothetical protein
MRVAFAAAGRTAGVGAAGVDLDATTGTAILCPQSGQRTAAPDATGTSTGLWQCGQSQNTKSRPRMASIFTGLRSAGGTEGGTGDGCGTRAAGMTNRCPQVTQFISLPAASGSRSSTALQRGQAKRIIHAIILGRDPVSNRAPGNRKVPVETPETTRKVGASPSPGQQPAGGRNCSAMPRHQDQRAPRL